MEWKQGALRLGTKKNMAMTNEQKVAEMISELSSMLRGNAPMFVELMRQKLLEMAQWKDAQRIKNECDACEHKIFNHFC